MKSRGRFSAEELRHLGFRIRAVRILTGLNQEEFSAKHNVPYISLKNWEQGKFTPRSESILAYLKALETEGIQVDPDWLYFGSGPGPTYLNRSTKISEKMSASVIDKQIAFFKERQLSMGLNPIISHIEDDLMFPDFKCGDIVGGVFIPRQEVIELSMDGAEIERPFLVLDSNGKYYPRHLFINDKQIFINSNKSRRLLEYTHSSLAKINWYYSDVHNAINNSL